MKLRALPQSFWQQPNHTNCLSPGAIYPILPPLSSLGAAKDDVENVAAGKIIILFIVVMNSELSKCAYWNYTFTWNPGRDPVEFAFKKLTPPQMRTINIKIYKTN